MSSGHEPNAKRMYVVERTSRWNSAPWPGNQGNGVVWKRQTGGRSARNMGKRLRRPHKQTVGRAVHPSRALACSLDSNTRKGPFPLLRAYRKTLPKRFSFAPMAMAPGSASSEYKIAECARLDSVRRYNGTCAARKVRLEKVQICGLFVDEPARSPHFAQQREHVDW